MAIYRAGSKWDRDELKMVEFIDKLELL